MTDTPASGGRGATPDGTDPASATPHAEELRTWCTWREADAIVCRPRHLRRRITIALVVGTILFAINQLDVLLRGDADGLTCLAAGWRPSTR